MANVVYTEIVLTAMDQLALTGYVEDNCPMPEGGKMHLHHCTIKFRPTEADCDALTFGEPVPMRVKGLFCDGDVAAFEVEFLHHDLPIANPVAHVTAWTAEGVSPRFSNKLLAEQKEPVLPLNDLAVGYVSWFDGEDQEHKESNPYPKKELTSHQQQICEALRSRPWDSGYCLAFQTSQR